MKFEWNENKRTRNIQKHGIDFSELKESFSKPMVIKIDSRKDYRETRWIALGDMKGSVVVFVYTEKNNKIRLISARKATKNEQRIYYKKIYGKGY